MERDGGGWREMEEGGERWMKIGGAEKQNKKLMGSYGAKL